MTKIPFRRYLKRLSTKVFENLHKKAGPVITGPAFFSIIYRKIFLFQQHHLADLHRLPGFQAVDVHAAGQFAGVPVKGVLAGF